MILIGLMRANRKQMDAYDALARSQAETSYRMAQIAMGIGLVMIIVGVMVAVLADTPSIKYAASLVTAVGAATGGYIARTFVAVQQAASKQMNFYFRQPCAKLSSLR